MAAKKKRRSRRSRKGTFCGVDFSLAKFNPKTGKKFRRPMCVPKHGNAPPRPPHRMPKPKIVAIDCSAGFKLHQANPNTGKKRPTCVKVLKTGKVRTKAPHKGKRSRADAVQVSRTVAIAGRRR